MWSKVSDFIGKHQLLSREGLHLVALSGGADSVALLLILRELGYRIEAIHCNFHLRDKESERDESFVKALCQDKKIPLHLIHFDTNEYASVHQVSIEMAARELRYRYFEQIRQDLGAEAICVAHHRDDANETLLMNLMRGAGIHGLTGIRPRNGHIVRPLLGVSRDEIEDYLQKLGQAFVTDSTNLQPDVLRNKIRLQLLPLMEQIQPGTAENLSRSSYYLSEAEKVYNAEISRKKENICSNHHSSLLIPHSSLTSAPSPLCLLHELLMPLGFNRTQIELIMSHLNEASGKEFVTPTHTLVINRDTLIVEPIREPMKSMKIPETGTYRIDDSTVIRIELLETVADANTLISREPLIATLDAAKISFPLTVRPIQQGDRFRPFGMTGQKLVSDYLTDIKQPLTNKRRQLVITDATGSILWLVGLRTDHRFRITSETTSVLRMMLI
jgi:tRNA(Ile)-lysidine synthase